MPANLNRRVELLFPMERMPLKKRAKRILEVFFRDNVKARRVENRPFSLDNLKRPRYFVAQSNFVLQS